MQIQIPARFNLLGLAWQVKFHAGKIPDTDEPEGLAGHCDYDTQTITLDGTMPSDALRHTFMHELMHACLHYMGRTELNGDEAFVDLAAGLLMQALESAR